MVTVAVSTVGTASNTIARGVFNRVSSTGCGVCSRVSGVCSRGRSVFSTMVCGLVYGVRSMVNRDQSIFNGVEVRKVFSRGVVRI